VNWDLQATEDGRQLAFNWIETGVKLAGEAPKRRGFGLELIERTLAYDLGGRASLEFGANGVHCSVALPADDRVVQATPGS
jgi:two-component system CheB/CheR fusion protein